MFLYALMEMAASVTNIIRIARITYEFIYYTLLVDFAGLTPDNLIKNFKVLKKCRGKLECLIYEMLLIKNKRPKLNTQADSIRAKPFT